MTAGRHRLPAGRKWLPADRQWPPAAAAVAGALALTSCAGPSAVPAPRSPASSSPASSTHAATPQPSRLSLDCPAQPRPAPDGAATLPVGAVAMRWCSPQTGLPLSRWVPVDVVTRGVGAWLEAFNARPALAADALCAADAAATEGAVLLYPDGSTHQVWGMDAGCRTLGGRTGFLELRARVVKMVQQQRETTGSPTASPRPCQQESSLLSPRREELVRAAVCAPISSAASPVQLSAGQLRELVSALPAHDGEVRLAGDGTRGWIQLSAASGDFLQLWPAESDGWWLLLDGMGRPLAQWQPDGRAAQLLADAVG